MRLVSWNIRAGGGVRSERIGFRLRRWKPDVVALSEFRGTPASQALGARLGRYGLAHQRASVDPMQPARNALLVASRWPLQHVELADAPAEPCRWLSVRVMAPEPFLLGAMHIPNRHTGRKGDFHDAVVSIANRWRDQRAILTGDTNSGCPVVDEQVPCFDRHEAAFMAAVKQHGWADSFRHLHGDRRVYSWYSPNGNNGFRLDQTFVSAPLIARIGHSSYAWGSRHRGQLSDHSAMLVDIGED